MLVGSNVCGQLFGWQYWLALLAGSNVSMCVVDMVSIGLGGWPHISDHHLCICSRSTKGDDTVIHCNYGFPMSWSWSTTTLLMLMYHIYVTQQVLSGYLLVDSAEIVYQIHRHDIKYCVCVLNADCIS